MAYQANNKKLLFAIALFGLVLFIIELSSYIIYKNFVWDIYHKYIDRLLERDLPFSRQMGFLPHHYLNYDLVPDYVDLDGIKQTNPAGFRGPSIPLRKPEGTVRIVCFGASTTYGTSVKHSRDAYPYQLETFLRKNGIQAEVINAGIPHGNILDSLLRYLMKFKEYAPDIAVIYQGYNDILALSARQVDAGYTGFRKRWRLQEPGGLFKFLIRYSYFARVTGIGLGRIPGAGGLAWQISHKMDSPEQMKANWLKNSPKDYFSLHLSSLIRLLKADGVKPLVLQFCWVKKVNHLWGPEFNSFYDWALYQQNHKLERIAAREKAAFFKIAPLLPEENRYFADCVHMTAEGNALRGKLVGRYLLENDFIPFQSIKP